MERRNSFSRKIDEPKPTWPLVEIVGDKRVLIERHKGVVGYDTQKVCVRLSFGVIIIDGCNLEIVNMTKTQLVITGRIQNVSMKRSG